MSQESLFNDLADAVLRNIRGGMAFREAFDTAFAESSLNNNSLDFLGTQELKKKVGHSLRGRRLAKEARQSIVEKKILPPELHRIPVAQAKLFEASPYPD